MKKNVLTSVDNRWYRASKRTGRLLECLGSKDKVTYQEALAKVEEMNRR